jgi:hypothetical protein
MDVEFGAVLFLGRAPDGSWEQELRVVERERTGAWGVELICAGSDWTEPFSRPTGSDIRWSGMAVSVDEGKAFFASGTAGPDATMVVTRAGLVVLSLTPEDTPLGVFVARVPTMYDLAET